MGGCKGTVNAADQVERFVEEPSGVDSKCAVGVLVAESGQR